MLEDAGREDALTTRVPALAGLVRCWAEPAMFEVEQLEQVDGIEYRAVLAFLLAIFTTYTDISPSRPVSVSA